MPWKEYNTMDERLKFVARLLDGEKMSKLCREFGISRQTGYKIYNRYKNHGVEGLEDQSRRPHRHANALPDYGESSNAGSRKNISALAVHNHVRSFKTGTHSSKTTHEFSIPHSN